MWASYPSSLQSSPLIRYNLRKEHIMIKQFLQRLGLIRPTEPTIDEHITYAGDTISLQRKNYPTTMRHKEEYDLYSDITWEDTVALYKDECTTIYREDISIYEGIRLLQQGYTAIPF